MNKTYKAIVQFHTTAYTRRILKTIPSEPIEVTLTSGPSILNKDTQITWITAKTNPELFGGVEQIISQSFNARCNFTIIMTKESVCLD